MADFLGTVMWFIMLFFVILVHELGHYHVMKHYGVAVKKIVIGVPFRFVSWTFYSSYYGVPITIGFVPYIGFVQMTDDGAAHYHTLRIRQQNMIMFAGPLVNLSMAALLAPCLLLATYVEATHVSTLYSQLLIESLDMWIMLSLLIGILNLVPVAPLDGGQMVANLLRDRHQKVYTWYTRISGLIVFSYLVYLVVQPFFA